jgi:NAD-dependent dihydropyrimidine dehydrogenase PreA subunit
MSVLINFKICDNAQECNGIAACLTGALSWDQKKKSIKIDNEKCLSCGKCEKTCMVDAIHVAKNEKEYQKIKEEIDADPRKVSNLFIDRYGAQPVHLAFLSSEKRFQMEVLESEKLVALEIFNDDSVMCLLKSIPMKELLPERPIKYRKMELGKDLMKKYGIKKLPSLLFFEKGKMLGKIEGYYDNKQKEVLNKKIGSIIGKKKK